MEKQSQSGDKEKEIKKKKLKHENRELENHVRNESKKHNRTDET